MLLYGCETPGSKEEVWNCGEMSLAQPGIASAPVCKSGSQVRHSMRQNPPRYVHELLAMLA